MYGNIKQVLNFISTNNSLAIEKKKKKIELYNIQLEHLRQCSFKNKIKSITSKGKFVEQIQ